MPKKHFITSALPYINGVKHLGNLIGSLLPADVYAKYLRQKGEEVLFICGTDEHGTPAEIAAQNAGEEIESYCRHMYETQKDIYARFGIHFDYFGRSSSPSNHALTQEIFRALDTNGYLSEKTIELYFSPKENRFLPDRYVEGTCPHCHSTKARGDQCDKCGTLLDPQDLVDPFSSISGDKELILKETQHIFLNLDKSEAALKKWCEAHPTWPKVVQSIVKKWFGEGLKPRCITRDLKWGVQVPKKGYEDKVFYVWFDAPNAYISITQDWAKSKGDESLWKSWWRGEDISYTQFLAKDNIPFHAIFWPAILTASQLGYHQVDYIKGFHWLSYEKGKFSTSQKRGVFLDEALELYPADFWRYYLLSQCPETDDSNFSFLQFASIINKDLADILGNFVNRTLSLCEKHFGHQVPLELQEDQLDFSLIQTVTERVRKIDAALGELKFRRTAELIRSLWVLGNEYITQEQPWALAKTDKKKMAVVLVHCLHLIRIYAVVSYPFIPDTSQALFQLLKDRSVEKTSFEASLNFCYYRSGHPLEPPHKLFDKIPDEAVEALTKKYAGAGAEAEDSRENL